MIDLGLLLSIAATIAAADLLAAWRPPATTARHLYDLVLWPALIGVTIGRVASMILASGWHLGDIRELFILRGGVELVPGVAGAVVVLAWSARRDGAGVRARLADVTPYALAGLAGFQATCVVREGCYGPTSPIGLHVVGADDSVLPAELLGAVLLATAAVWTAGTRRRHTPSWMIVSAVALVGVERSIASIWQPAIGAGLSRPHLTSLVIAAVAVPVWIAMSLRRLTLIRTVAEPAG